MAPAPLLGKASRTARTFDRRLSHRPLRDVSHWHRLQAATTYPLWPLPFEEPSCASNNFLPVERRFTFRGACADTPYFPLHRDCATFGAATGDQPIPQSSDLRHQLRP